MSKEQDSYIEQDQSTFGGPNDLPSYDELAAQNGPNSRRVVIFGRWRGWIEKRAAERYADLTLDERRRRRARGWGNYEADHHRTQVADATTSAPNSLASGPVPLHIHTSNISISSDEYIPQPHLTTPNSQPLPFVSQRLSPTHLRLCQFGSRFLPHATSPIRCLLPLLSDRYLLIGHDEGLSVLDMFPRERTESGDVIQKGPHEATSRQIWTGESVHQMSVLEMEDTGEGIPQGVVLALVGREPGSPKDVESSGTLRMYNLASLISLAKWAVSKKGGHPLDLCKSGGSSDVQQTPSKRHRAQNSIARSLKSLIEPQNSMHSTETAHSYQKTLSPVTAAVSPHAKRPESPSINGLQQNESPESPWELIEFENLPLRWANDYVPLASQGSRLLNVNVLSYAIWSDENRKGKGGQLLAVVTKNNILLYETPKGERAFRFVKEFYTPLQPRSVTFFQQNVQDFGRNHSHRRTDSSSTLRGGNTSSSRASHVPSILQDYGTHISLFVIFDKKTGWIRIADSAVGEMELFDENAPLYRHSNSAHHSLSPRDTFSSSTGSIRRRRHSSELHGNGNNRWIPISKCDLSVQNCLPGTPRQVHLLTRGNQTRVVPCPLPINSPYTPLWIVHWKSVPIHVASRACGPESEDDDTPPFLQIIALGGGGIEVQEIPFSLFVQGHGKGKARMLEPSQACEDLGGPVGFLCTGGHWDDYAEVCARSGLYRTHSNLSDNSVMSFDSLESEDIRSNLKRQEGIYGWCSKGLQDWRVFWIGGTSATAAGEEDTDVRSEDN
ncbi:hypothetical protein AX17_002069 [Amanita inopinata Kibby_2008]|nr:hypothetical protein AX17_002069 [Amanita inopinata Kibby_2008]